MLALESLVENLSVKNAPVRLQSSDGSLTTHMRVVTLSHDIEEAVWLLQEGDAEQGMNLLQAQVEPVVNEVHRIEWHLGNLHPSTPDVAYASELMQRGIEAYYDGMMHLATCLEDLDPAHLIEARRLFNEGHRTLQAAKECVEDSWDSDVAAA